jgi:hypothetical protein
MPNYSDINYWENRYSHQNFTFDWLEDYNSLKPKIVDLLKSNSEFEFNPSNLNTLIIGCGNSELSENLYKDLGLTKIFNIDTSSNVIRFMQERCKSLEEMKWDLMDARDLKFNSNHFDLIIDKCTSDSMFCGDNPFLNVAMLFKEVQRVVKVNGVYMIISHGDPEARLLHLKREHLSFDVNYFPLKQEFSFFQEGINLNSSLNLGMDNSNLLSQGELVKENYVYLCKKKPNADQISEEHLSRVFYELEKLNIMEEEEEGEDLFEEKI